jgi:hypothetical protein
VTTKRGASPDGMGGANLPFRWDLVRPDALGSLLDGLPTPILPLKAEMVACAATVLARSGGGRLLFVGRSADSLFDFLKGVVAETALVDRVARLPFSYRDDVAELSPHDIRRARNVLTACNLTPQHLIRGTHPVALVDLVYEGHTFTSLYRLLRAWGDESGVSWSAARRKLRFVGVTACEQTSPKTWRWQQHVDWTRELPARAVVNVSVDSELWRYWGNWQPKLTRSFHRGRWADLDAEGPQRDVLTRAALAEALALVEFGRTSQARRAFARALTGEPAISEPWLRKLIRELR